MNTKTKAQTLAEIGKLLTKFRVPDIDYFTVADWYFDPRAILARLACRFGKSYVAVRSSTKHEDGDQQSRAGAYVSLLNIPAEDMSALGKAICEVIESYTRRDNKDSANEVIVQRMVGPSLMSGVAFTHDLNTGAPYYVINYDDVSGRTNTVTAGEGDYSNRTIYIHRPAWMALRSPRFRILVEAIDELEKVMESQFLDVEFAIGVDLAPYLLQVRKITTQPNWNRAVTKRINETLDGIQAFVKARMQPARSVLGQTTVLGQMPDWNPAEMLGRTPRALALSLYQTLITDHAWRIARETMGYAVPIGQPLMVSLAGQPFVDTRLSFHSFLPASLDTAIGTKLVDAWVSKLRDCPDLHDKVEFSVAITCYSFDLDDRFANQIGNRLSAVEKSEYKTALHEMTRRLLADDPVSGISAALVKVEQLATKPVSLDTPSRSDDLSTLFLMIHDCIRFGTVPFSILARHAFIARTLLLSLKARGIFDDSTVGLLQASIRTVASELVVDMHRLRSGDLSQTDFMALYGHLRPGTYDILSPRYDSIENFGQLTSPLRVESAESGFELSAHQRRNIDRLLKTEGFHELGADCLLKYVRRAIVGREYAKFVFTRSVSAILELIAEFGNRHGLSRDELSHIEIRELLDVATKSGEFAVEDRLRSIAEIQVDRQALSAAIRLPQVLSDEAGVRIVPFQVSYPNFITSSKVVAPCLFLSRDISPNGLDGHIILVESADPGFDWIFSRQIKGLVTKYGGANSHMAIRCAEFGIPAAIGCGEQRFELLCNSHHIMLDCAAASIQILH